MSQRMESASSGSRQRQNPFFFAVGLFVLVLVVLGFVFFGSSVGDGVTGPVIKFGSYAGKSINAVEGSYFMTRAGQYAQTQDTSNPFAMATILLRAFDDTVLHLALMDRARDLGVTVSDRAVLKYLAGFEAFQDAKGNLDIAALTARKDYNSLMEDTRAQLLHDQLINDYLSSTQVLEGEKSFIASTYGARRVFDVVTLPASDYPVELVRDYATKNQETFTRLSLSSITVATKDAADKVLAQLQEGTASFADLAKANSTDTWKEKGGVWDPTYLFSLRRQYTDTAVTDAIKALKAGETTGVLQSGNEYLIVRANENAALPSLDDEAFLGVVRSYMEQNERGLIEDWLTVRGKEIASLAGTEGLAAWGTANGKEVKRTNPLAINTPQTGSFNPFAIQTFYGAYSLLPEARFQDGTDFSVFTQNEGFWRTAFSLPAGGISEPIVVSGQAAVLSLVEAQTADETEQSLLVAYLDTIVGQLKTSDIQRVAIDQKKLDNRFSDGFSQWTGGQF